MSGEKVYCVYCGQELKQSLQFCTNCGYQVDHPEGPAGVGRADDGKTTGSDGASYPAAAADATTTAGSSGGAYTPDMSGLDAIGTAPVGAAPTQADFSRSFPGSGDVTQQFGFSTQPGVTQQFETQSLHGSGQQFSAPIQPGTVQYPPNQTVQMNMAGQQPYAQGQLPYGNAYQYQQRVYDANQTIAGQPYSVVQEKKKKRQTSFYVTIGVIAAVVVALALIAVLWVIPTYFPDSISILGQSSETSQSQDSGTDSESTSSVPYGYGYSYYSGSKRAYGSEEEFYEILDEYYSQLENYDARIAAAATDFNNNYTKESFSTRESYASTASSLADELSEAYEYLNGLTPHSNSVNNDTFYDILTCYYDCYMRITVIKESWERSLEYSNPIDHQDYITEPLVESRSGGQNMYKAEFDEIYPNCSPVEP